MGFSTPLLIAALVATTAAGPTGLRQNCATTCSEASNFAFERGMKYEYDYQIKTNTKDFLPIPDANAELTVTARATIDVVAPCEYVLTMSDVNLESSSHTSAFSSEVTKSPLRFGFDDGRISDVCSQSGEEVWITNFKRGILSMFQNTMANVYKDEIVTDVDITGECETEYKVSSIPDGDTVIIERSKSSDSCQHIAVGSHSTLPPPLQKLLLSSKETCTQQIKAGIIDEITCNQFIKFRESRSATIDTLLAPIAAADGAITKISTTLTLVSSTYGASISDFEMVHSSLEFDGLTIEKQSEQKIQQIEKILQELNKNSLTFVKSEVPMLFSRLVENLRHLDTNEMEFIYQSNRHQRVWMFLVDAAPMVATPASMSVVSDLVAQGQMTPEDTDVWFTSMGFIPNPELDMFLPLPTVLKIHSSEQALLGVSAMINSYCKKDSNCEDKEVIRNVLNEIEKTIGSGCRSYSYEHKEKILVTLKALGNAGRWINSEALERCFLDTSNPAEVRVAAIEVWRRAPCNYERSRLMELYTDSTQDSELRIASYLSMMACPTEELIETIRNKLSLESVNQVGSFVWSHLSNLQESASQEKQWIREIIGEDVLVNKFNTSALKFSRNYESSFYMEEQGFGTTVESNVIFSKKSFLPRSGMFNLTFDVFGQPLNVLEIGGRIEGLEIFIEKFFGPNGYYPEETVEAIIRGMRQSQMPHETTLEHMLEAVTDEQEGSYYVRLFGNDVHYHHFRGIENFFDKSVDFNIAELVMELAQTGKLDYTKAFNLVDSEFNYPTVSGLPLQLKLNSKAIVGLRMDGEFSFKSFSDIAVVGHIYPSASIHSDVSIMIDAHFSKYGRKATVDMETSAYLDGKLHVQGGQLVDISLNMPQDKVEVINVQQKKLFIEDDVDVTPLVPTNKINKGCTLTSEIFGAKLCFSDNIKENMNYNAALFIEKTDSQTGYILQYSRNSNNLEFLMDTPGSEVDRKVFFSLLRAEDSVEINIETPWKKMLGAGTREETENGHKYSLAITADRNRKYEAEASYSVLRQGSASKIESSIKLASPEIILINTYGTYEANSVDNFMKIDIQEKGQLMPASLQFSSECSDTAKKTEAFISSHPIKLSVTGSIDVDEKFASQFDAKYSLFGQPEESVSQYIKYKKSLSSNVFSYEYAFSQEVSHLPQLNVDAKGKLAAAPGHLEASTSLRYGEDEFEMKSENLITYNLDNSAKAYDVKMSLVSTTHPVDILLTQKFKLTSNSLFREGYLRLTPYYVFSSRTEAGYREGTEGFIRVKISTPSFEQKHEFSFSKIAEKYYIVQVLSDMNGTKTSIDLNYQDRSSYGSYIDIALGAKINAIGTEINSNLALQADKEKGITLDATSDYKGRETFVRLDATPTKLKLESNVYKSLLLEAKVTTAGPTRSVDVEGQWDGTDIMTKLSFNTQSIAGNFMYGSIEKSFNATISSNGVRAQVFLDAVRVVETTMEYEMDEEMVFTASLNTPFEGYEKQSAVFAIKRDETKAIDGRINVTWKNAVLLSLTVMGNLEIFASGSFMNVESVIVGNPDILGFERFHYELKHSKSGPELDSMMSGILDGNKIIDGKLESNTSMKEKKIQAYLKTPITEDLVFDSEYQIGKSLTFELSYGNDFLKLEQNFSSYSELSEFKYNIELLSSVTEDLRFESMLTTEESSKLLEMEAMYGKLKGVAVFTQDVDDTADVRRVTNTGRIILPQRTPITGTLIFSQKKTTKHTVTEFEITRFWSSYGSLKIHSDLTVRSLHNIESVITISSPDNKMIFETLHKLEGSNFEGFFKSSINGEKFALIANGIVKELEKKLELNSKILFQDELLMRMSLNYEKQVETHVTKLKLNVREKIYNVHHELSFADLFNWSNELSFNDFLFKNTMNKKIVTDSSVYTHNLDWNMMDNYIRGTIAYNRGHTNKGYHTGLQIRVSSSEFQGGEIEIDHFNKLELQQISLVVTYGHNDTKLISELLFGENWIFKTDITARDINDISVIIERIGPSRFDAELMENGRISKVTLFGDYTVDKKAAHIALTTPHLPHELIVDGIFEEAGDINSLIFSITSNKLNRANISWSNSFNRKGQFEASMELPYFNVEDTSFGFEFDSMHSPIEASTSLKLRGTEHGVTIIIHPTSFELNAKVAGITGKFESSWKFSPVMGNIDIKASSPEKDFLVEGKIAGDRANKEMEIMLKYNSVTILSLIGKQEGRSAVFQGELFILMKTLYKANVLCNDSHFSGTLSQDDKKIEVTGNYNFNRMTGKYAFKINTPFMESVAVNGDYNLSGETKIYLEVMSGEKEVTASLHVASDKIINPSLSVHLTTFMEKYRKIGTSITYDIQGSTKILDVKLLHNDDQYTWKMEVFSETLGKGLVVLEASAPLIGLENTKYGLNYDFSKYSYKLDMYREKNMVRDQFSFEAEVNTEEKSVSGILKSSVDELKEVTFLGKLNANASKVAPSVIITVNNADAIRIDGLILKGLQNPTIEMKWVSPYEGFKSIEIQSQATMSSNEIEATMKFSRDNRVYDAKFSAKKLYKKGAVAFVINTPLQGYSSLSIKGDYNILDDVKVASVDFGLNGVTEHASLDLELNENHIKFTVITPIQNYENIYFEGNFISSRTGKEIIAKVQHGSTKYNLFGSFDTTSQQFTLRSNAPLDFYGEIELSGGKTTSGYSVIFKENAQTSEIKLDFNLDLNSFFVRLETPLSGYRRVALEFNLDNRPGTWISTLKFEKENFVVDFGSKIRYSDFKSHISLTAKIPAFDQDFASTIKYDFTGPAKTILTVIKMNGLEETFEMTADYEPSSATFKITIPFINKEIGAEYRLYIDRSKRGMDGLFKVTVNEEIYEFTAKGKIEYDKVEIIATTPFEMLDKIQGFGSINQSEKTAEVLFQFGQQKVLVSLKYNLSNALVEIQTPFENLKHLKLAFSVVNEINSKELGIEAIYNEQGNKFSARYQPGSIFLEFNGNDTVYMLEIGGEVNEQSGGISVTIRYPGIEMLDYVHFSVSIDLTSPDKAIQIILRRGEDIKEIALSGRFIDDEAELRLKTPIAGFESFHTRGSLSRSKRSLEFSMMNDSALGAIRANFNSLSVDIKTPYSGAREATFSMERTDGGGFTAHYKRGDNHFDMTVTPTGRRRSFEVSVSSAIPGWEYLAITGRLDKQELIGYLSGQINEEKMTIEGGGKYSRQESDLNFAITTPYEGYESVSVKLKSNLRRKDFTFEIKSGNRPDDFHIKISTKPTLVVDMFIPNPAEPTIMKASFSLLEGKVSISSRFPKARSFNLDYKVVIGRNEVEITSHVEQNGVELFKLEFKRGGGVAHLMIDARRGENHSTLHFHRQGLESISFTYNRNGKEFKLEGSSSGNPLQKGTIDIVINNSFRDKPVTVTGKLTVDRTGSPKKIKLELTYPGSKLYIFDLSYNLNLRNPKTGDYKLAVTTPTRRASPWQNISGSWDFTVQNKAKITFKIGRSEFTALGKFGLNESDFVLTPSSGPEITVTWRFYKTSSRQQRTRDYYLRVGTRDKFVMAKLKGTFNWLEHGDAEFALQTPSMAAELDGKINWHRDASGLSGNGSFTYGSRSGTFTLNKLKRYAETRSAEISFVANTNIPGFTSVSVEGNYSFNNEAVLKLDIVWDTDKISINFDVHDIFSEFTEQTASFTLPALGDITVTFGHDFRNKKKRTFTAIANVQGRESFIKAEWNRNKDFTKLSGKIDAKSIFLGDIHVTGQYDVRDIHNANAEFHYSRNSDKALDIKWTRVYSNRELNAEVSLESSLFGLLRVFKLTIRGQFVDQFKLNGTLQINDRQSAAELAVVPNSITFLVTTPREGFERIEGSLVYDFSDSKQRTATLRYTRGDIAVKMDFELQMPSKNNGQLTLKLETPFDIVRTLDVSASWKNRKGEVHYKRNDIEYHFSGQADIKSDRTSFDGTFTPTSQDRVKIAFTFNTGGSLVTGRGDGPEDIAKVELEMLGKRVAFDLKGFRNQERIMIDISTESTLDALKKFDVKLDSELSTQERDGLFEITINDFHFRIRNHFERKSDSGYYFRTEIDTTMTALPGIIFGFGREGDACILTVGLGEDREVTISVIPKKDFKKGFSGKLSLPKRGIIDAPYDVNYSFSGKNILNIDTHLELEPGKMIEADIVYNSDGVKARFTSPKTGKHVARAKRSVTDDAYFLDLGVDEYAISLLAKNIMSNKGFIIEGEVFGKKVTIDSMLNIQGPNEGEGRFIVSSNFDGYETLGGLFTFKNPAGEIHSKAEINLPSHITPKVFLTIDLDLKEKIKGLISLDVSGQVFSVQTDVTGSVPDGFTGKLVFNTPFNIVSQVTISGYIKLSEDFRSFDSNIAMVYPLGRKELMVKYSVYPLNVELNLNNYLQAKLLSLDTIHKLTIDIMRTKFSAEIQQEHDSKQAKILLDLRTIGYINSPIIFEATQTSTTSMKSRIDISLTILEETHSLSYMDNSFENPDVTIVLQSSLIGGRHMIVLKIDRPRSSFYSDSFAAQISYVGVDTYDLIIDVDRSEGIKGSIVYTCPQGIYRFFIEDDLGEIENVFKTKMHLKLPHSEHDLLFRIEKDIDYTDLIGQIKADVTLSSSLLSHEVSYSLKVEFAKNTRITEQVTKIGDIEHSFKAGYAYSNRGSKLEISFDTPLFELGKNSITAELKSDEIKRAIVKLIHRENLHSLDIKVNMNEKNVIVVSKSGYWPGGMIKGEVSAAGKSMKDLSLLTSFKYDKKNLSAKFNLDAVSLDHIKSTLEVKTPFTGYKKLNLGASFIREEFVTISFYADKPLGYSFELKTGKDDEVYKTEINIETPHDGFETISAGASIAMNKISPTMFLTLPDTEYGLDFSVENDKFSSKVEGNANIDGKVFGAGFGFRNSPPYEFSYFARSQDFIKQRFHIMMDSSFYSLFSLFI